MREGNAKTTELSRKAFKTILARQFWIRFPKFGLGSMFLDLGYKKLMNGLNFLKVQRKLFKSKKKKKALLLELYFLVLLEERTKRAR